MNEDIGQIFERPKNVTIALRILWFFLIVSTGVSIAFFSLNWDAFYAEIVARMTAQKPDLSEETLAMMRNTAIILSIVAGVITVLLSAFFYYKIGEGRNWARIVLLVLAVLGIAYHLYATIQANSASNWMQTMHGWTLVVTGTGLLSAIGTVVALVLLFTGDANAWFHTKK